MNYTLSVQNTFNKGRICNVFESRLLRIFFNSEESSERRLEKMLFEELNYLYSALYVIGNVMRMRWIRHEACLRSRGMRIGFCSPV
jgi:hypothetical protein